MGKRRAKPLMHRLDYNKLVKLTGLDIEREMGWRVQLAQWTT